MNPSILYLDLNEENLIPFIADFKKEYSIQVAHSIERAYELVNEHEFKMVIANQHIHSSTTLNFLVATKKKYQRLITIYLSTYDLFYKSNRENTGVLFFPSYDPPYYKEGLAMFLKLFIDKNHLEQEKSLISIALKESIRDYKMLIENTHESIIIIDREHKIIRANKVHPGKDNEVFGLEIYAFIPKKDHARIKKLINYTFKTSKPKSFEVLGIDEMGTKIWFKANIAAVIENKKAVAVLIIGEDISENKQYLKDLNELNEHLEDKVKLRTAELEEMKTLITAKFDKEKELGELKSRFVSVASHQFRTPLTVIQSNLGLLEMYLSKVDDDSFKSKFDTVSSRIKIEIERMTSLMNDVLVLGKINEGRLKAKLEPSNIIDLTEDLIEEFDSLEPKQDKIKLEVSGSYRDILLDKKLMGHAISNLISNALKYSKGKKTPLIKIKFNPKSTSVQVIDYGIGIPNKDIKYLFDPFYRASNVSDVLGTGLGTSISKEYTELNNGKLSVKSEINKGSEFKIIFKN